ncbi:hypothetical protein VTK73DRAFT_4306 [Phialemonium thermophilum]|uniref:Uncharacterized protein n=1 Tax=Phialemonium thermophilum TaxID=223376 RepID=A0ABR3V9I5_9PEZI
MLVHSGPSLKTARICMCTCACSVSARVVRRLDIPSLRTLASWHGSAGAVLFISSMTPSLSPTTSTKVRRQSILVTGCTGPRWTGQPERESNPSGMRSGSRTESAQLSPASPGPCASAHGGGTSDRSRDRPLIGPGTDHPRAADWIRDKAPTHVQRAGPSSPSHSLVLLDGWTANPDTDVCDTRCDDSWLARSRDEEADLSATECRPGLARLGYINPEMAGSSLLASGGPQPTIPTLDPPRLHHSIQQPPLLRCRP